MQRLVASNASVPQRLKLSRLGVLFPLCALGGFHCTWQSLISRTQQTGALSHCKFFTRKELEQ